MLYKSGIFSLSIVYSCMIVSSSRWRILVLCLQSSSMTTSGFTLIIINDRKLGLIQKRKNRPTFSQNLIFEKEVISGLSDQYLWKIFLNQIGKSADVNKEQSLKLRDSSVIFWGF